MNDQFYENDSVNDFFENPDSDKYDVSETIQQHATSSKNFALFTMIVSIALLVLLIGSFAFSMLFPSIGFLAILTLPVFFICSVLEIVLMIGAIILNIIALVKSNKLQKEFKLFKDGPEKKALESTVKLGKIFTYVGAGVAALALLMIVPLNSLEFVLSMI